MKRKFFNILFALVLVLSLSLVMATPVAAEPDVTNVSVAVVPPVAGDPAEYTITFTVNVGLYQPGNVIRITFPDDTVVPATISTTLVTVTDLTDASTSAVFNVEVVGQMVKIWVPTDIEFEHVAQVVFAGPPGGAGIVNATAPGSHCLQVNTDEEPNWVDGCYTLYEAVGVDVYLKYQIPPADCGYVEDVLVGTFLTIGEGVDFVDKLYQSGTTAIFTIDGDDTLHNYGDFGDTVPSVWTDNPPGAIGDILSATGMDWDEDEVFEVTYNLNDGTSLQRELTITTGPAENWVPASPTGVVDVVSVVGINQGTTPGYQNSFELSGDTYNTAGAYGDFGVTTAGTWTDGTSIGEGVTVDVTTDPTPNPETYTVTYYTDDATGQHKASLTVQTNGTLVWSPAGLPSNVVDIDVAEATPAWEWESECPTDGGLIGARVLVRDGTYLETFNIRTPGVMVESLNGAEVTIIDAEGLDPAGLPASMHIAAVMITAEGVTFGGTGDVGHKGFTVKNAGVGVDAGGNGKDTTLWADDNSDGIADVSGVYIWPNGGAYRPQASVGHGDTWCRVNVLGNIIKGSQARGIRADAVSWTRSLPGVSVYVNECTVYDNLFDGFSGDGLCVGPTWLDPGYTFTPHGSPYEWGYTAIVDSEFYHNGGSGMGTGYSGWTDAGIEIGSTVDYPFYCTCYIVGNNIHDNTHAGIHLLDDAAVDTLVIKFNQIVYNGVFGISTRADNPLNIACVYNNIEGNPDWGIKNWEPQEDGYYPWNRLVAKLNWWGDKSGPSDGIAPLHPSEDDPDQTAYPPALGVGDAVSHFVIYQWWLTCPFEDVQEDLIRYYGSDRGNALWDIPPWTEIVPLVAGWNTMSTPVALDERADQMGEICALGGWMQNYVLAYSYDAVSGWDLVTGDFQLLPLEAIYIRMSGPDYLPILLRNTNWMPARDLEPGWNLVSLNVDFHGQNIQSQDVETTLTSISGSWSNAISPSMPGQQETWVCTPADDESYNMSIGDGYWVFITKPTTLAGICMAPWYLEQWEMDILDCGLPPWPPWPTEGGPWELAP